MVKLTLTQKVMVPCLMPPVMMKVKMKMKTKTKKKKNLCFNKQYAILMMQLNVSNVMKMIDVVSLVVMIVLIVQGQRVPARHGHI